MNFSVNFKKYLKLSEICEHFENCFATIGVEWK